MPSLSWFPCHLCRPRCCILWIYLTCLVHLSVCTCWGNSLLSCHLYDVCAIGILNVSMLLSYFKVPCHGPIRKSSLGLPKILESNQYKQQKVRFVVYIIPVHNQHQSSNVQWVSIRIIMWNIIHTMRYFSCPFACLAPVPKLVFHVWY